MATKRGNSMRQAKHTIKLTERQQEFKDNISSPSLFMAILSGAEVFEKNWKKDLLSFTKKEALEYLSSLESLSILTLMSYASTIRAYADFMGVKETAWREVLQEDLKGIIDVDELKNTYFTPENVRQMEAILPNTVDKFILRGFYEGLYGNYYEEFRELTMNNFDKENLIIRFPSGKEKKISSRLYDLAEISSRTYTYKALDFRRDQTRKLLDMNGLVGEIVKSSTKVSDTPGLMPWKRKIRGRMEAVKAYFGLSYLTIPRLRNSGIYYQLLQIAKEYNCDIAEAVYLPEFDKIIYQYDLDKDRKDKLAYKYKNMSWADEK